MNPEQKLSEISMEANETKSKSLRTTELIGGGLFILYVISRIIPFLQYHISPASIPITTYISIAVVLTAGVLLMMGKKNKTILGVCILVTAIVPIMALIGFSRRAEKTPLDVLYISNYVLILLIPIAFFYSALTEKWKGLTVFFVFLSLLLRLTVIANSSSGLFNIIELFALPMGILFTASVIKTTSDPSSIQHDMRIYTGGLMLIQIVMYFVGAEVYLKGHAAIEGLSVIVGIYDGEVRAAEILIKVLVITFVCIALCFFDEVQCKKQLAALESGTTKISTKSPIRTCLIWSFLLLLFLVFRYREFS